MKKNYCLDWLLFLSGLACIATGLLLDFHLIPGGREAKGPFVTVHTYSGYIMAQQADEAVLTDGVVDYDKLQPIIFDIATKTYRLVGPVVGKAFHDGLKLKS